MKKYLLGLSFIFGIVFAATSAFAYSGELYRVCGLNPDGDNFLSMRTCGSTDCDVITKLLPGTFMWTMEPTAQNNWRQVVPMYGVADMFSADPDVGFVYSKYICKVE
ncbi:hypothetical protein [Maritalea myrionectae]|uniref:hypothetical protein n=1 Tax=Maritalea myrionectae TaxID=454601 RepID=UPI0004157812|nr:hypothetical protein [Maritalea myrionectae]